MNRRLALAALACAAALPAFATGWPAKPITMIVPFPDFSNKHRAVTNAADHPMPRA